MHSERKGKKKKLSLTNDSIFAAMNRKNHTVNAFIRNRTRKKRGKNAEENLMNTPKAFAHIR